MGSWLQNVVVTGTHFSSPPFLSLSKGFHSNKLDKEETSMQSALWRAKPCNDSLIATVIPVIWNLIPSLSINFHIQYFLITLKKVVRVQQILQAPQQLVSSSADKDNTLRSSTN